MPRLPCLRHVEEEASEKAAAGGGAIAAALDKKAGGSPKKDGGKGGDKAATAANKGKAAAVAESILEPISAKASGGDDEKVPRRWLSVATHGMISWLSGGHREWERSHHPTSAGAWSGRDFLLC